MTYRTILVHADLSRHAPQRIRFAATLARTFDAHLVGGAMTGVSRFLLPGSIAMGGPMIADQVELMRDNAERALVQFDALADRPAPPHLSAAWCRTILTAAWRCRPATRTWWC